MVDLTLIEKKYGCTEERLKAVFTAREPADIKDRPEEEQERIRANIEARKRLEEKIQARISDGLARCLKNHPIYSAVDLAWDSTPINRGSVPLMLYAQGKLNVADCAVSLEKAGFGKYVERNAQGKPVDVNIPKFYEVNVNLIRSILTRRLAAQSNKYANLWPYYKYEARGTSLSAKLKADALSQVVDIISDQFNHRHQDVQAMRDMLLYGHCVEFVRCAWEKEQQERTKRPAPGLELTEPETVVMTTREGLCFVNPHPSRVCWDNAYPLASLNTDTGLEWIFFWDIKRYKDAHGNPAYWNKERIGYSSATVSLFSTYSNYFSQYYCTITPPCGPYNGYGGDLTSHNDRLSNLGVYSTDQGDSAMVETNMYWKIIPKDWGLGEYMHPVWLRLVIGGEETVMFAEWLPSSPGSLMSYNENDSRQLNISFAHELMGYQDQLTNLLTYLMLCLQADHIKVLIIDTGVASPEHVKAFREQVKGTNQYTGTVILEVDRQKLVDLGVTSPDQIIKLVETKDSAIDMIFRAISTLVQFVERMAALSPQEQGQPAPREISATETNLIAGTTESVYGFISDSIDEARAAKKRILYESYLIFGDPEFHVPVVNRYPRSVIEAAGLKAGESDDLPNPLAPVDRAQRFMVNGPKDRLEHDYIFSSRDGAERPSNTQAANVLVQLLSTVMSIPQVASKVSTEQLFGMVNEVFRQSGAGHDLNLELQPGAENEPGPDPNDEIKGVLEGLVKATESNQQQIQAMMQGAQSPGGPPPGPQEFPPGAMAPPGLTPGMMAAA